jgi:hypothetical protein
VVHAGHAPSSGSAKIGSLRKASHLLVLRGGQRAIFEVNRVMTKRNAEEYGGANHKE